MNELKELVLTLDPNKLEELSGGKIPEPELQRAFFKSLDGLKAVFSSLGSTLRLPQGICALLKHAYECIIARDFAVDVSGGTIGRTRSASFYPLVRLLLQGLIGRIWKEPLTFNCRVLCQAKIVEIFGIAARLLKVVRIDAVGCLWF